jgi:hypothetical protein
MVLVSMISVGIFMQSCSNEDLLTETLSEKQKFPSYADNYGKAVAKELRHTVESLNKMGVDYSKANKSTAFKEQFYENLYKVNPIMLNKDVMNNMSQMNPAVFAEKVRNLTGIQIEFIQHIIKECEKSISYNDLSDRLLNINKDIYSRVPEIEQERLFNITAVLYYGAKEIQNIEKQGQMLRTPHNDIQRVRLKSGNESGDSFGGSCSSFLATAWAIALFEPTPTGEIVMAIVTVIYAGILLYEITVCTSSSSTDDSSTYNYCQQEFDYCYSPIPDGCSMCLQFCLTQGYWPPVSTHECY